MPTFFLEAEDWELGPHSAPFVDSPSPQYNLGIVCDRHCLLIFNYLDNRKELMRGGVLIPTMDLDPGEFPITTDPSQAALRF